MDPLRTLHLASVALHLLAAAVWVGGMLFLVLVLVPLLRVPELRAHAVELLTAVGRRFRGVGWASLLVLVVTGFVNAALRAPTPGALADAAWWETPFGRLLGHKLALVAAILALSAVHDFFVGPRAASRMASDPGSPGTLRWRLAASWMGRLNLLLAVAVIVLAVALVRGGW